MKKNGTKSWNFVNFVYNLEMTLVIFTKINLLQIGFWGAKEILCLLRAQVTRLEYVYRQQGSSNKDPPMGQLVLFCEKNL